MAWRWMDGDAESMNLELRVARSLIVICDGA